MIQARVFHANEIVTGVQFPAIFHREAFNRMTQDEQCQALVGWCTVGRVVWDNGSSSWFVYDTRVGWIWDGFYHDFPAYDIKQRSAAMHAARAINRYGPLYNDPIGYIKELKKEASS